MPHFVRRQRQAGQRKGTDDGAGYRRRIGRRRQPRSRVVRCSDELRMRLSFLAAVMATAALGAPAPVPDPLVGLAHAAPPEFASDALLRIAEKATLTQDAKIELLEEAFRLAQSAHFSIPYRSFRAESDSLAATRNQAYRLHLDALSLQTRAVRALLPLAPAKARQYFEQIRLPQFPALTCADALIPDVASFYDVLGQVAQTTFSPKERAKEDRKS